MTASFARSLAAAGVVFLLWGCPGSGAGELLETAKFEELQRNVPHARQLYQQILSDHPDSPEAAEAKKRLAELEGESSGG